MSTRQQHRRNKLQDQPEVRRALASLAMAGDQDAFECLYALAHPNFIRLAYRLCSDMDAARDIVQDAAIIMARKINRLKDPSAFTAWAYRIIRYRVQDYFRKQQRRGLTLPLDDDILFDHQGPDLDTNLMLRQSLNHLNKADRQLLILFYVDGFTGVEISGALDIPLGTVKSRLFKIREKLKSIYTLKGDYHE